MREPVFCECFTRLGGGGDRHHPVHGGRRQLGVEAFDRLAQVVVEEQVVPDPALTVGGGGEVLTGTGPPREFTKFFEGVLLPVRLGHRPGGGGGEGGGGVGGNGAAGSGGCHTLSSTIFS